MFHAIIISFIASSLILYIIKKAREGSLYKKYMLPSKTPDEFYCPKREKESQQGLEFFKTKRLIIAGLVRDSDDNIDIMKQNVKKLEQYFLDICVLIIENDSKDRTRPMLLEWAKEDPRIHVLGCGLNADTCHLDLPTGIIKDHGSKRIRKMVLLRNIYMDYISENTNTFKNYDFLIAIDFDIKGTFYSDGIGGAGWHFATKPQLQGLCANGVNIGNYGLFIKHNYHDPYAHKELKEGKGVLKRLTSHWGISLPPDRTKCSDDIRQVRSCFNGFSIYRLSSIMGKHYEFKEEDGEVLCEHVTFNTQLDQFYLDPHFIFVILANK